MPRRFARLSIAFLAVASLGTVLHAQSNDAAMDRFVDHLLAQMTPEEKALQMEQAAGQPNITAPAKAEQLARQGIGSFLFFTDPVRINELQRIAVTESRLHIPLLFGYDVIHGFRTIAPVPLAMASSWDPALVERTQSMAAREARAAGIDMAFAPMVDIARDARWGRIMEGAGEDPFLGSAMAAAQVRGFQGPTLGTPGRVIASVKHFAGYGAAPGGRDYEDVDISEQLLRNVYLPPFHAAVDAGADTLMAAYMDLNSVPASANTWLLRDVLRKEWGFKGFVISDWNTVHNFKTQGYTASGEESALRGVEAGLNMEMTGSEYRDHIPALLQSGKLSAVNVDALVRPILEMKYRLGLFTNPYVSITDFQRETLSAEQRTAARIAAEKTAVLLRNENHALPLSKSIRSLAVIGPLADSKLDTMGSWAIHGDRNDTVTILQGLREALPSTRLLVAKGVEIERGSKTIFDEQVPPDAPTLTTDAARSAAFEQALQAARDADSAVLVLGEAQTMSGENASRGLLNLPGEQQKLLEAVVALGKPVVLVLMTGRPLDITWASTHVPAILNVWYPGTEGGHAVVNLLLGNANPGGHLPLTWPREVGQEPMFYNATTPHDPGNNAKRTWDIPSKPLYPFGYGLSYATFQMEGLKLTTPTVATDGTVEATVTVRNTSNVAGEDVLQLYTHQRAGSAARPARELKAFEKISLGPNETKQITLKMPATRLTYWSAATHHDALEPGMFDVWVGDNADASLHSTFQLTAAQ